MSDNRKSQIGNACVTALKRFAHESVAFMAARVYLLKINLAVLNGTAAIPIKEAHDTFAGKLVPHYDSPYRYFIERLFISLVAAFELFLQDVVTAVVAANPKKIGQVEFKLTDILDSTGQEELVRRGIEATLNKLMYKKPLEYLAEIASLLSIDQAPLRNHWSTFVEAKARRDLGVHSGWRCNAIYVRKVIEAGLTPSLTHGESAFPSDDKYLDTVSEAFDQLASLIIYAVTDKHCQ